LAPVIWLFAKTELGPAPPRLTFATFVLASFVIAVVPIAFPLVTFPDPVLLLAVLAPVPRTVKERLVTSAVLVLTLVKEFVTESAALLVDWNPVVMFCAISLKANAGAPL
jgi:hypothetical protein